MAAIAGTIKGMRNLHKDWTGFGTRETWLVSINFAAYTASTDTATVAAVGAAIDAIARDGKVSVLRGAVPIQAGSTGVLFTGASVQALTVSTDALTGQLGTKANVDTTSAASAGHALAVIVDRA